MDVVTLDHHVAEGDADAQLDAPLWRQPGVSLGQCLLDQGGGGSSSSIRVFSWFRWFGGGQRMKVGPDRQSSTGRF